MAAQELFTTSLFNDANLVSYYRFEGNSTDAKDGNNGADTGITYGTAFGKFGQGATFNGASSKIDLGVPTNLNLTGDMSIGAWVYGSLTGGGTIYPIIGKDKNASINEQYSIFEQNGTIYFRLRDNANGVNDCPANSAGTGAFQLVVGVISGTNMTTYINGTVGGTKGFTGTRGTNGENVVIGGTLVSAVSSFWSGNMDDFFIFNRALAGTEVSGLFNGTLPPASGNTGMMTTNTKFWGP